MISGCHQHPPGGPPALVLAHPGHELRLLALVAKEKPVVHVLACGSRDGTSCARVQATRRLVEDLGATAGQLFGNILDRDLYRLVLAGKAAAFHAWVDVLRDAWLAAPPSFVVTDAWQLYSVAHDLVHLTARVAAREASVRSGVPLACFDYAVVPPSVADQVPLGPVRMKVELTQAELEQKLERAYAFPEIAGELAEFAKAAGPKALGTESLHEPLTFGRLAPKADSIPNYERYGEERVAAGIYTTVLRWAHVQPLYFSLVNRFKEAAKQAA